MIEIQELVLLTQINKNISLEDDRADELASFLNKSRDQVRSLYRALNIERSITPPAHIFMRQDHASVVSSYLEDVFLQTSLTRIMLHYNQFALACSAVNALAPFYPNGFSGARIIDYGAGAADYSLAFATLGATPIVVDLEGPPLDFCSFHFRVRGIKVDVVPVTKDAEYPELPSCEIVYAAEVLEHVSNPMRVLLNTWESLSDGGFLIFSDYPMQKKMIGGTHLKVASDRRLAAKSLLHLLFEPIYHDEKLKYVYVYRKRK